MHLPIPLLPLLLALATSASALLPPPTPPCTQDATVPSLWRVQNLNVTYTDDETVRQGNASLTFTDVSSGISQDISCALRFNYVCEWESPGGVGVHIWLQLNLNVGLITVNQTGVCVKEGQTLPIYLVGNAELYLVCPDDFPEGSRTCASEVDDVGVADGIVMLPEGEVDKEEKVEVKGGMVEGRQVGCLADGVGEEAGRLVGKVRRGGVEGEIREESKSNEIVARRRVRPVQPVAAEI